MKRIIHVLLTIGILIFISTNLSAQGKIYEGPSDGAGDPHLEREGFMQGNRVQLLFKNNTELGDYPRKDAARWPKGIGGNVMHDGIGLLVSAKVYLQNKTQPVTDTTDIKDLLRKGLLDSLFYCQTNYREEMDRDETGQIEWGFHPAPGYMNNSSESPALSNDTTSWPKAGWPFSNSALHWPGEWDGRFGRGQIRSDLECYFVANDAQDLEYLGDDDMVKYYPRPGINIGDIHSGVTVQNGKPWGGLGVRVKQRGFQWNNPMAQDCIFWEYTIANISDFDLPYVAFGYWIDNDIGGENRGEDGSFDKIANLAYTWDTDGVGEDGYNTGTQGFAFLESPGISNDEKDNDDDGLLDEKRDNPAGIKIGATAGIDDLTKFLSFYGLQEEDLKDHFEGDEDQDWQDGEDLNDNGKYDDDEFAGDDIGLDGVAPGEENYFGPDEDGTECNHQPDLSEGYAEPNFGWTDVSETDMLGLTTLMFYEAVPHVEPYKGWFKHDESVWDRMAMVDSLEEGAANISNLFELFSSAIFPLYQGRTEFISLAELHSYDDLSGLKIAPHSAPALFTLKKTVQIIYEKDYRFAQPPAMPRLSAIPGDGFVYLVWDDRADKKTRESLLNNENDFEGYKIYRATDRDFTDPVVITDGYGTKTLMKPIFQCDLRNGKQGFTDYGLLNGMAYNLGFDTGLAYSFKDENVKNGRTYYYAVAAYDYGIPPDRLKGTSVIAQDDKYGISPSENNVVIRKDEFENVEFIGQNVAIVTPGARAAGISSSTKYEIDNSGVVGTGSIIPEIIASDAFRNDRVYKIKFHTTAIDSVYFFHVGKKRQFVADGLYVYNITDNTEKLVYSDLLTFDEYGSKIPQNFNTVMEFFKNFTSNTDDDFYHLAYTEPKSTDIFDGMQLHVQIGARTSEMDPEKSGWMPGNSPMRLRVTDYGNKFYPLDCNIVFSDQVVYTALCNSYTLGIVDANMNTLYPPVLIYQQEFNFRVENLSETDSLGAPTLLDMIVYDLNDNDVYDMIGDQVLVGKLNDKNQWEATAFAIDFLQAADESKLPAPNDVYSIRFQRPFINTDSLIIKVSLDKTVNEDSLKKTMDEIKVVPNPYVATNLMETSAVNKYLNQQRRIMFTNIPQNCTVKILTVNGVLIRALRAPGDALTTFSGMGLSNNGVLHWDMLTEEGLEIAAGMYIYHIKDDESGEERMGKFGVIK
ncbi:hypothetical protein ISS22_07270 [candidate division KSB1 bacterium]|nr:hypothetical protein [candidate division KSB1 bacterium]